VINVIDKTSNKSIQFYCQIAFTIIIIIISGGAGKEGEWGRGGADRARAPAGELAVINLIPEQ